MRTGQQPSDFASAFIVVAALVAACLACPANASAQQQPAPSPTPAPTQNNADTLPPPPDLSITGRVEARELRFNVVPNPKVEFTGRPRRETVWEADRENLPPAVRPGETYRNIGITLRITSVFADIDRIVAEALGEIPSSDADAAPDEPTPPQPPPQQQSAPPQTTPPPAPHASAASSPRTPRRAPRRAPARRGTRR